MPVPTPRILPGRLHKDNKGCVDWGCQNLVAYGCHSYIVVVDPYSMSVVQTLDEHIAPVCLVKWSNDAIRQDSQYVLKLASGDASGNIIVWNVQEGSAMTPPMTDKPVLDLKWHPEDSSLIAALHAPNSICLWSVTSGTRIWKKDVSDHNLSTFIFDPFEYTYVTVASAQGFIYEIRDFKSVAAPSQVEFKYKINSRLSKQATGKQPVNIDFVQMMHSPHTRHVVYIMLSRELLIFDTTTNQSLGTVVLERSKSNFAQMCLYKESPELLVCLHEDGAITAWVRKKDSAASHNYEMVSIGDLAYLNKKSKKKASPVVGISRAPCSDHTIAAICADGSLCTWNFSASRLSVSGTMSPLSTTITSICVSPFDHVNPKVAFGTTGGTIVIANFQTRSIEREFVVGHPSQAIHGVKWIGSTRVVCFACDESQDKPGMYKNTLCWLDIQSGKIREFRRITAPEPTFIRGIRVSPLRQYLILLLKDRPFELWELRNFSLTRTFKQFTVTALEWAIRDAPPPSPTPFPLPNLIPPTPSPPPSFASLSIPSFSSIASTISSMGSNQNQATTPPTTDLLSIPNDDDLDLHSNISTEESLNTDQSGDFSSSEPFSPSSGVDDANPRTTTPSISPTPLYPNNVRGGGGINTSFNNIYFSVEDERTSTAPHTMPEMFVFTSSDGVVRFFSVDGSNITPNEIQVDLGPGVVSSLAWKNDLLVSGDTAGTIHCWHLDKRRLQTYATHKGLIKRIRFSPAPDSTYVLVLFAGGDFGIWDLQHGIRLSISNYLTQREVKATEVDWLTEAAPIITTTDGCARVLDKSLSISNSRIPTATLGLIADSLGYLFVPLATPHVLNDAVALHLKAILNHQSSNPAFSFEKEHSEISNSLVALVDPSFLAALRPLSVAERCLKVARYFGDTQEIDFWILALNFLEKYSQPVNLGASMDMGPPASFTPKKSSAFFAVNPSRNPDSPLFMSPVASPVASPRLVPRLRGPTPDHEFASTPPPTSFTPPSTNTPFTSTTPPPTSSSSSIPHTTPNHTSSANTSSMLNPESFRNSQNLTNIKEEEGLGLSQNISAPSELFESPPANELPLYFDLLLPGETIKDLETERANVHASKPSQDAALTKTLVEKNILVGRNEKAVNFLLDTNVESNDYITNSLKACVIAATMGQDSLAKTVKVVATSMIASNRIDEGVQLLCLIGKGLDACRYLQSYDRWHDAALVAKTYLSETECNIIMRRWSTFLISSNQKLKAVHILLSLGEFQGVLQILRDIRKSDIASLFALACIEKRVLNVDPPLSTPPPEDPASSEEKEKERRQEKEKPSSLSSELLRSSGLVDTSQFSPPLRVLLENIYNEYAGMLQQVGCTAGALLYMAKSGRMKTSEKPT